MRGSVYGEGSLLSAYFRGISFYLISYWAKIRKIEIPFLDE
jgi:hypothetical protein